MSITGTDHNETYDNIHVEEQPAGEYPTTTIAVDFLYLDREVCERCSGTEEALHTALEQVADVLSTIDIDVSLRKIHVETEADARLTKLEVSPTIRIDGRDIQPAYIETACESSGDLCTTDDGSETYIDCREWQYRGETYTTLPVPLLVEELLRAAVMNGEAGLGTEEYTRYRVPENLQAFFGSSTTGSVESDADNGESTQNNSSCC